MKNNYNKPNKLSALAAKEEALKLAFSPIAFQAVYALRELGILKLISEYGDIGISAKTVAEKLNISRYGIEVLLNVGLSCKLVWQNNDNYVLDKIGHFFLSDSMVTTNLEFMQHFCYQGLFYLIDAIKSGKPEGLKKVFGNYDTLYPALPALPEPAKSSWFAFDHYYSDKAFPEVLPIVFSKPVKRLFDVGGNTGKWTLKCLKFNPNAHITILDLPEQLKVAKKVMQENGVTDRVDTFAINLLDSTAELPKDADVIWMSQFLDCFAENEIAGILKRTAKAMNKDTRLYIMETFRDRQIYEAAAFAINCTSIYFTCMANGNSRMYHSKDLIKLIHGAGLSIEEDIDHIGVGHTLLCCRKR